MLIVFDGASGVGKSALIQRLAGLRPNITIAPPPWWPEFDEFVTDPMNWATRNQRGAIRATGAVLADEHPGLVITDASLRRTRLFNRALRDCCVISADEATELDRLCVVTEEDLSTPVALNVHLRCDEPERRRRLTSRHRPSRACDLYWQVQDRADALLGAPPVDGPVLSIDTTAGLDVTVLGLAAELDQFLARVSTK
jgi:deoxyadenosine/deoxycytidine kinase